jgi:hypothetical protein
VKQAVLEKAADVVQAFKPFHHIHTHLCGLHFRSNDMTKQVEAHHYCSHLTSDFCQCVIYDSGKEDARLIGIEYIISERLFKSLPNDEKVFWHSHQYEIKSGLLIAPGLPQVAEKSLMTELANTYGKTIHTWKIEQGDALPLGGPQLMMAFTAPDQVNPHILELRDKNDGLSMVTSERAKNRADIPINLVAEGADFWKSGKTVQFTVQEIELKKT